MVNFLISEEFIPIQKFYIERAFYYSPKKTYRPAKYFFRIN